MILVTINPLLSPLPLISLFQTLRLWGRRESKRHAKSWRGGKKEKGKRKKEGRERAPPPLQSPGSSRFIFVFALSQFSGPDYLAWSRLPSNKPSPLFRGRITPLSLKPPSPPPYYSSLTKLMIDCINQSRLQNFEWTDPGWFIHQLEAQICF